MESPADVIANEVPESLARFLRQACGIAADAVRLRPGRDLPEPARQLLVHRRDMTSTLATFHGSDLRVDVLQQGGSDGRYVREVFLRTVSTNRVVEYGVIAIALDEFSEAQQDEIRAGHTPLGALLHRFRVPFESRPIGYFSIPGEALPETRRGALEGAVCYGRFNRLAKPTGEPLAWIMEILPPTAPAEPRRPRIS